MTACDLKTHAKAIVAAALASGDLKPAEPEKRTCAALLTYKSRQRAKELAAWYGKGSVKQP